MSRKPPEINGLLQALREFGKAAARRPAGEGWQTIEEIAIQEGLTIGAVRYRLKAAQQRGVVLELAVGTALDAEGRAKRSYYYRLRPTP